MAPAAKGGKKKAEKGVFMKYRAKIPSGAKMAGAASSTSFFFFVFLTGKGREKKKKEKRENRQSRLVKCRGLGDN